MLKAVDTPRVYVSSWSKYNAGSLKGAWLSLEEYPDRHAFLAECRKLHSDETDPEFAFQDFEGFPREFYSENGLPDALWAWLALDEDDRELLAAYYDHSGERDASIEDARDHFWGKFESEEEWAENFLEETGALAQIPENLRYYFDFEAYAKDARLNGDVSFIQRGGEVWVFNNH